MTRRRWARKERAAAGGLAGLLLLSAGCCAAAGPRGVILPAVVASCWVLTLVSDRGSWNSISVLEPLLPVRGAWARTLLGGLAGAVLAGFMLAFAFSPRLLVG